MPLERLRSLASLLRWLGPWAGERSIPGVSCRRVQLDSPGPRDSPGAQISQPSIVAKLYGEDKSSPAGVYVVTPGLHFLGPDDPRLDRFCRVLAKAGFLVVAPLLPDFLMLRVVPGTSSQLAPAFDFAESLARKHKLGKPALFSISFGSMPALELAARDDYRSRVGRLVLFGGFCELESALRHAVLGEHRDPLNSPVVFSNLLRLLEEIPMEQDENILTRNPPSNLLNGVDQNAVQAAWRAMVERTWGKPELKLDGARDPFAHELAKSLGERERRLFLAGCGLDDSARDWFEQALEAVQGTLGFTDPRPHLKQLEAPVAIIHGRDDDVIPFGEAEKLSRVLGAHPHRVLLTGFYGHTGSAVPSPRSLLAEAATMLSILSVLAPAD